MKPNRTEQEREAERRRRLAEAFGEALPESAREDRPESWGESSSAGGDSDEWLRSQVPPHHG